MNQGPRTAAEWETVAWAMAKGDEVRSAGVLMWRDNLGLWWVRLENPPGAVQFSRSPRAAARKAARLRRIAAA